MSFNFETEILLNDIDHNLEISRQTFKNFDERFKITTDAEWTDLLDKVRS